MPGAKDVYLKQAGTGAAWMGPESSFDPVLFAREAAFAKLSGEAEQKKANEKAKNDFMAKLKVNPGEVLDIDKTTTQQRRINSIYNAMAEMGKGEWTQEKETKLNQMASQFVADDNLEASHRKDYLEFSKMFNNKDVLGDEMQVNGAMWINPATFVDQPEFAPYKSDYEQIKDGVLKTDPDFYGKNPDILEDKTRLLFRDRHRELLSPIQKPIDIYKDFDSKRNILVNEISQERVKGGYNLKDVYSSEDDVEIEDTEGNKISIAGIRTNAAKNYNDPDVKYSAQYNFNKQPDNIKDKYKLSDDPVRDWYVDEMVTMGRKATTSKSLIKTGGGNTNFGAYSVKTDWKFEPFNNTLKVTRDAAGNVWDGATIDGFSVGKGENQLDLVNVGNIPFYYKSNDATQNKVPGETTSLTMKGVKPFMAPTFSEDLTWSELKTVLESAKDENTGRTALQDFYNEFGYLYRNVEANESLDGIILKDKEVDFFKKRNLGKYVAGGEFATGELSWTDENGDKQTVASAIVPLSFVKDDIKNVTNVEIDKALDIYRNKYEQINTFNNPKWGKKETKATTTDPTISTTKTQKVVNTYE